MNTKHMPPQPSEELAEAKSRARNLICRGFSASDAARRMASEFFICIYASRGYLWASWQEKERTLNLKLA